MKADDKAVTMATRASAGHRCVMDVHSSLWPPQVIVLRDRSIMRRFHARRRHTCWHVRPRSGLTNKSLRLFLVSFLCWSFISWQHLKSYQHGYRLLCTDSVRSMWLYSTAPSGDQATRTMTRLPTQSYYPDTELANQSLSLS